MKAKKGEEGNVLGALFTLGELREDQESPPPSAVSHPDTLQTRGQAVQEAFSDAPSAHDGYGTEVLVGEIGEGKEDADGEDPFRDVEGNKLSGLNLGGPFVEGKKLVGREHVDGIDGERDDQREPEVAVGERREARGGLEIIETLETKVNICGSGPCAPPSNCTHNEIPLLFGMDLDIPSTMPKKTHGVDSANQAQENGLAGPTRCGIETVVELVNLKSSTQSMCRFGYRKKSRSRDGCAAGRTSRSSPAKKPTVTRSSREGKAPSVQSR